MIKYIFILFFILQNLFINAQETNFVVPDSLQGMDYAELTNLIYKNENKTVISEIYAKTYLDKAKRSKNILKISEGYHFLSYLSRDDEQKLALLDSIIFITKNKTTQIYPAIAYLNKGTIYFKKRKINKALNCYIKANSFIIEKDRTYYLIKHNMGLLKNEVGDYEESILFFKECIKYFDKKKTMKRYYISSLYSLSESYTYTYNNDSATVLNKLGVSLDKKYNYYYRFLLNEGVNLYLSDNLSKSIDSINKSISYINKQKDIPNLIIANYYLGKSYLKLKEEEKALSYFIKVDSIMTDLNNIIPEVRDTYEILLRNQIRRRNKKKQLYYINKLVFFDSILNTNYKYLSGNIIRNYDTKELTQSREDLIQSFEKKTKSYNNKKYTFLFLTILALILSGFYYSKQRSYKRKFEYLLQKDNPKTLQKSKSTTLGSISKEKVADIIMALNLFEEKTIFIQKNITLNYVAQICNTNTSYLSKVINHYKKQNFTSYLNKLRINYAVNNLKINKKLHNYTIEAIANEFGYNNAESFSKAFFKETGIYPSFFINNIKKKRL